MPRGIPKSREVKADSEAQVKSKPSRRKVGEPKKQAVVEEKKASNEKAAAAAALPLHCEKLYKVLNEGQKSVASHNRGVQAVMKLMESISFETFMDGFVPALNRLLVVFKREPSIERLVKFVTLIATNQTVQRHDLRDQFLDSLLNYLVTRCDAKDKAVRFRCCQIIASVLKAMDPDSEIVEELFAEIEKRMLVCARDKFPVIRVQAIYALSRLQTDDGEGEVSGEYRRILQTDSHKDCRRVALGEIALCEATLGLVLERTKDTSAEVRKQAFTIIKGKIPLESLSPVQRNWLVKQGLRDRDEGTRKACSALIQHWLVTYDNDIIKLLAEFEVETYKLETEQLTSHILKEIKKHDTVKPPFGNDLTPEMALYWRVLCNTLEKHEEVDVYLPDTVQFCQLLQDCNSPEGQFVLHQLLQIALFADLQDEAGRKQLEALYRNLLCSKTISTELIPTITKGLRKIYDSDEMGYVRGVLEIVSEIRDPVTGEEEEAAEGRQELEERYASLSSEMDEVKAELQVQREMQKSAQITKLQKHLITLQQEAALVELELSSSVYQDETTWSRMLYLVADLLQHLSALRGPGVTSLLSTTILPALQLGSESIQDVAIRCLGLYCSLDLTAATVHLRILLRVLREDDSLTLMHSALQAVLDLVLIFDSLLEGESKEEKAPDGKNEIVDLVATFLPKPGQELEEGSEMASCAVEGIGKLLLFNRVPKHACKTLLTKLLVVFFDASARNVETIRQYLTVFWLVYSQSRDMHLHNSLLAQCFVPTLRAVTEAPSGSSLAKVTANYVSQYMVGMLRTADAKHEQKIKQEKPKGFELDRKHGDEDAEGSFLQNVATEMCHMILHNPEGALCKACCHALSLMDFSRFTQFSIKSVRALLEEHAVEEKASLKCLVKVLNVLEKLDDKEQLSPEDMVKIEESKKLVFEVMIGEETKKTKNKRQPVKTKAVAKRSKKKAEEWDETSEEEEEEVSEDESEEEEEEEEEDESEEKEEDESEEEEEKKAPQRARLLVKPLVRSSEDEEEAAVVVRAGRVVKPLEKSGSEESDEDVPVFDVPKGRSSEKQEMKSSRPQKQPYWEENKVYVASVSVRASGSRNAIKQPPSYQEVESSSEEEEEDDDDESQSQSESESITEESED